MVLNIQVTCESCDCGDSISIEIDTCQGRGEFVAKDYRCNNCDTSVFINVNEVPYTQETIPVASNNTSGITGVSYHNWSNRWRAQVRVGGKTKLLGSSHEFEEAVALRYAVEQCLGVTKLTPACLYMTDLIERYNR